MPESGRIDAFIGMILHEDIKTKGSFKNVIPECLPEMDLLRLMVFVSDI